MDFFEKGGKMVVLLAGNGYNSVKIGREADVT